MKQKHRAQARFVTVLICLHEILLFILGMSAALALESKSVANGIMFIFPLALSLVAFGWILHSSIESMRK